MKSAERQILTRPYLSVVHFVELQAFKRGSDVMFGRGLIFLFAVLKTCTHLCNDLNTTATIPGPCAFKDPCQVGRRSADHCYASKNVIVAKQQKQQTC